MFILDKYQWALTFVNRMTVSGRNGDAALSLTGLNHGTAGRKGTPDMHAALRRKTLEHPASGMDAGKMF